MPWIRVRQRADVREGGGMERLWFRIPALLWLPAGIVTEEVLRTGSAQGMMTLPAAPELLSAAACGVPLALACRRLSRSGYPGPALVAWLLLGAAAMVSFAGALPAGVQAVLASLPVWVVAWRLERRPSRLEFAPSFGWRGRGGLPAWFMLRALSGPEAPRRNRLRRTS